MRRVEFQMMPGDHVIMECGYDTTSRLTYTRGGLSVSDEMCMMFLHYYPATSLAHCVSKLPLKNILLAMGVTLWPVSSSTKQLGLRIRSPVRYQNLTLSDYLAVVLPGDMDAAKRLQEANLHHSQQAECYDFGKEEIIAVSVTILSSDHDITLYDRQSSDTGPATFTAQTYDPLLRHFTTMPSFS